jgi:hypothetical protein
MSHYINIKPEILILSGVDKILGKYPGLESDALVCSCKGLKALQINPPQAEPGFLGKIKQKYRLIPAGN